MLYTYVPFQIVIHNSNLKLELFTTTPYLFLVVVDPCEI